MRRAPRYVSPTAQAIVDTIYMNALEIINPKRNSSDRKGWHGFFPYYAGFSEQFARELINSAGLKKGSVVWDPWNGSGTTTSVAASLGFSAKGTDLNPVMVIVAKSRLVAVTEADTLIALSNEVAIRSSRSRTKILASDPLLDWFDTDSAQHIRRIEQAIRHLVVGDLTLTPKGTNLASLSSIAATLYVGLFTLARDLVKHAKTSNPTWVRKPRGIDDLASSDRSSLSKAFGNNIRAMVAAMSNELPINSIDTHQAVSITTGDTTSATEVPKNMDFVLTSPPYCTRLDYAAATRIEMALLQPWLETDPDSISRQMIGSTKVPLIAPNPVRSWGPKCISFLRQVRDHSSKASKTYYLKNHMDYFDKMNKSVEMLSAGLKLQGTAVLVVQDSYYKDIWNPLPDIISEMACNHGLREKHRKAFASKRSMSGINSSSLAYRTHKTPIEMVLCFERY